MLKMRLHCEKLMAILIQVFKVYEIVLISAAISTAACFFGAPKRG